MTPQQLIKAIKSAEKESILNGLTERVKVLIASDEEWNTLYEEPYLELTDRGDIVIYGLDGSEKEQL